MATDPTDQDADPTRIRVIVVHADDVVTALEARERGGRRTVLRVTPPFSGRMRARLHDAAATASGPATNDRDSGAFSAGAVHVDPRSLVVDPPPYPDPDETEDRLRDRGAYDVETHRERHAAAVADWRDAVRDRIAETVAIEITAEARSRTHEVRVSALGTSSEERGGF
ncbi:hypothetical protein [Halopenitus persicus]|uniref:DUF8009 domain-containing protein n=1 Tax=Halopenitus persicus TaxID=1048396 RepID=A0A1H3ELQ1_9EURY|nr:hypothetical protein [Halopenitus persicus]QHS17615.1 hypothetical protein GWK26_10920 [haloarchaeon 3A1-DGR]SDX79706.1 hypothetical protein SAMN05216564_101501 [Halopenitus persicus]